MTQKMRAKFVCQSTDGDEHSKTAKLMTEYSASPEDQMFNEATPYGTIEMLIDKAGAMDFLKPGKSYYVDFTEVPELVKASPDDIPSDESKPDETDEECLYRKMEIKVQTLGAYFMLSDYSGKKAPALHCGRSMAWVDSLAGGGLKDPFFTREDAVKAGMGLIDVKAPA